LSLVYVLAGNDTHRDPDVSFTAVGAVTEHCDPDERDCRLQVELDVGDTARSLDGLLGRLRIF
jgi:hypothetical protein